MNILVYLSCLKELITFPNFFLFLEADILDLVTRNSGSIDLIIKLSSEISILSCCKKIKE